MVANSRDQLANTTSRSLLLLAGRIDFISKKTDRFFLFFWFMPSWIHSLVTDALIPTEIPLISPKFRLSLQNSKHSGHIAHAKNEAEHLGSELCLGLLWWLRW